MRPFIHRLATGLGLKGSVENTAGGVTIKLSERPPEEFLERLKGEAPPLARIEKIEVTGPHDRDCPDFDSFGIIESSALRSDGLPPALLPPDTSTCPDCLRELWDPSDRRYKYPFINCTNCGPRYTITRGVPYDRPLTTMSEFTMCPDCEREYTDPLDRRFHAQPNACPRCGPSLEFFSENLTAPDEQSTALETAIAHLREGRILAIKGLGGFHLACDAENPRAVETLRERKRRSNKPFALMARGGESVSAHVHISPAEGAMLESPRRPIVLLAKKAGCTLPEALAPGNAALGVMLPHTPLHHLLSAALPLMVMTSGNRAEQPIAGENEEAVEKLSHLVDGFLLHNRGIHMRLDDSVAAIPDPDGSVLPPETAILVRRARGYVPEPLILEREGPPVLGAGADLKNTFTLLSGNLAIPGPHMGDMENLETLAFYERNLEAISGIYKIAPEALGADLHPDYLSSRWAEAYAEKHGLPLYRIGHHHAHIAAVMAEHGLGEPLLGVALDGTGYGPDGDIWGGEFLLLRDGAAERLGHFSTLGLPGGEAAVREPWRIALSALLEIAGGRAAALRLARELGLSERISEQRLSSVLEVAASPELSPRSSGAGRLFDCVAALMGIRDENTFEAEAPMALEARARACPNDIESIVPFPFDLIPPEEEGAPFRLDFYPALHAIIKAERDRRPPGETALRFHKTVARAVVAALKCLEAGGLSPAKTVALGGGVFQNTLLLKETVRGLRKAGFCTFFNQRVPLNDACVSLGQAFIVRELLSKGKAAE